jgi:hypothetical protein
LIFTITLSFSILAIKVFSFHKFVSTFNVLYFEKSIGIKFQLLYIKYDLVISFTFQVLTLRTVHEQLVRLLSHHECQELRTSEAFTPFNGLNPLQYNPYTLPLWKAAVAQYERGMSPAEQRIAGKLRSQFRGMEANSQQLLREFQRYKELIKRPSISKELVSERYVQWNIVKQISSVLIE